MPLFENQPAPDFQATDILGNNISVSALKGKKILLTFYRHVACPFTNLRFLELQEMEDFFRDKGLVMLAIYESSIENLKRYTHNESFYGQIIANPEYDLYTLYDIEVSSVKILFSMYRGAFAKAAEGKKRFKEQFCPEGRPNVLGGDFLIGEDGYIKYTYYNQYLGDNMAVKDIMRFANDEKMDVNRTVC